MNTENPALSRRRLLRLAVAGAGMLSISGVLAACSNAQPGASGGGSTSTSAPSSGSAAGGPSPAAAGPSPSAAAASASPSANAAPATTGGAGGSIKVGLLSTNSGPFAAIGQDMMRATQLYLAQHNNMIGGLQATAIYEDEGSTTQDALSKGRLLIEQDKVDVLTGIVLSNDALALRDVIDSAKVPTIITNAGAVDLTGSQKSNYIFRVSFSNWQSGAPLGKYAFENTGKKAIAMAPDYAAGTETMQGFIDLFTQAGGTILDKIFPPLGNSDYAPYLGNIKPANPDFVWAFFSTGDAIKFLTQWNQFVGGPSDLPLIGFGLNTLDVTQALGQQAMVARFTDSNYDISFDNPVNQQFVAAFRKQFNRDPQLAQYQYDGLIALDAALKKTNGDKSPEALSAAFPGLSYNGVRGEVTIDASTHGLTMPYFRIDTVQDGDNVVTKVGPQLGVFSPSAQVS